MTKLNKSYSNFDQIQGKHKRFALYLEYHNDVRIWEYELLVTYNRRGFKYEFRVPFEVTWMDNRIEWINPKPNDEVIIMPNFYDIYEIGYEVGIVYRGLNDDEYKEILEMGGE